MGTCNTLVPDSEQKPETCFPQPISRLRFHLIPLLEQYTVLPTFEFVWKVFVSLFAIAFGILALYWICSSIVYLIVLAVDVDVSWARKRGHAPHSDAVAKAAVGILVLMFLGVMLWIRH